MMNRLPALDRILSQLARLESYLKLNSAQNFNTSSVIAEDICVPLLNLVYDHRLTNLNADDPNAAAADLIYRAGRLAYQITINATTKKVGDTHATAPKLAGSIDTLTIFFLIAKAPGDPGALVRCTRPAIHKLDLTGLITFIRSLKPKHIESIADLLEQELGPSIEKIANTTRLHTIPAPPSHFTGRTTDLTALLPAAYKGGAVLTGLRGMGGIGKTALALVLAREWRSRFPNAQLFLDGRATTATPATAASLLSQAILAFVPDARLPDDVPTLRRIYLDQLHGRRVLLLLDNAKDAAQANPLVPADGSALIVTSRSTFAVGGHPPHNVGRLPDKEALALLRELYPALTDAPVARHSNVEFQPAALDFGKSSYDPAEEIATLCGHLPLALRIAGAHLALDAAERGGTADVPRYLATLRGSRLGSLDKDADDAGEITISETLRLSEATLTNAQRTAWRALGVFPAPFDEPAAAAITEADPDTLDLLVRRSLLERDGALLRLHDLAGDYTRAALGKDVLSALRLAHARHYTETVQEAHGIYMSEKDSVISAMTLFDAVRPHSEAAFSWLNFRADEESALLLIQLVNANTYVGQALRFHPRQGIAWSEAQARAAKTLGLRQAEGAAFGNLGAAHMALGEVRHALEFFGAALAIAQETGDRRSEGGALGNMGIAYLRLGDAQRALKCHKGAIEISRQMGDCRSEAEDFGNLGNTYLELDDARSAFECQAKSLIICKETGDLRGEANAWINLGIVYREIDFTDKALECFEKAMRIARNIGNRRAEGNAWGNMGNANGDLGNSLRAIECYEERMAIAQEVGDCRGETIALFNSAREFWKLDAPGGRDEARRRMAAAAEFYEAMEDPWAAKAQAKLAEWG